MDINKMTKGALKNYETDLECALIRAEVNEDIERYGKINDKLKAVRKILNADIIERDDNGNIIGYGSHADYDCYATEYRTDMAIMIATGIFTGANITPKIKKTGISELGS